MIKSTQKLWDYALFSCSFLVHGETKDYVHSSACIMKPYEAVRKFSPLYSYSSIRNSKWVYLTEVTCISNCIREGFVYTLTFGMSQQHHCITFNQCANFW